MVVAISRNAIKTHKVVLLGDVAVGKTSIMASLKFGAFGEVYQPTMAPDYFPHLVTSSDGTITKLSVWDTAGQEKFRSIIPTFLRDISVCILVFDITNRASFEHVQSWFDFVRQERGEDDKSVQFYLVGNKSDLADTSRSVAEDEGTALAASLSLCQYFEVSAKECKGIHPMFTLIAEAIPRALESSYQRTHLRVDHTAIRKDSNNASYCCSI